MSSFFIGDYDTDAAFQRTRSTRLRRLRHFLRRFVFLSRSLIHVYTNILQERTKIAISLKGKGNAAYQQRKFSTAIDYYTRAIAITPKPDPVFFSNRAACYVNLNPPQHDKVVEDCDAALALDRKYLKALNRRAAAQEALERYEEALRGTFLLIVYVICWHQPEVL